MPADQRDRRAHPDADAARARGALLRPSARRTSLAALAVAGLLGPPSAAGAIAARGWLAAGVPAPTEAAVGGTRPAAAAILDLLDLYRDELGAGSPGALVARAASFDAAMAPVAGEHAAESIAAALLRLRTQEAIALRLERPASGLAYAARAESLEAELRLLVPELAVGPAALLPLVAGLGPARLEAERAYPALYELWRRHWFEPPAASPSPATDGGSLFLLFHALAPHDARVFEDVTTRPARDDWEATLVAVAAAVRARRLRLFAADDPARRLGLAVRLLHADGVLPELAVAQAERAAAAAAGDAAGLAALDSLLPALAAASPRATPILGSRQNYYRRSGTSAPALVPILEERARRLGRMALAELEALHDDHVLLDRGLRVVAEPEPVEIVPGQPVAVVWTLGAPDSLRLARFSARLGDAAVAVRADSILVPAGTPLAVRTAFAAVSGTRVGETRALPVQLSFHLPGAGVVEITDRVLLHVVAPLQATLEPQGGPVVLGNSKSVELVVTSRAPLPMAGELVVLATSDWKVSPARRFRFDLRRPGQSARVRLDFDLPGSASPGTYDVAVRIESGGEPVGTLHTRLVRPLRWVVVGPFAPPGRGQLLGPERGVSLETRHTGLDGAQVVWQLAPPEAYDTDGSLDFEALFPELGRPACACAFTVLESPQAGTAFLHTRGAARVQWNGAAPQADERVSLENGRNALVVRACSGPEGWRLQATLGNEHGEPLGVASNELERLVDGFAALRTAPPRTGGVRPPDRLVMLRFRTAARAQQVAVLGTFNAWVPVDLQRQPDGSWQRELRLSPGRYAYKLMVDGKLRPDPEASTSEPDGFGGRNSLLIVR